MTNYFCYQPPIDYDLITGSSTLPVTLAEVKANLRIDPTNTTDDTLLTTLILAATNYFELKTGRDLINKTYACYLDNFPGNSGGYAPVLYYYPYTLGAPIAIKKSRLQSITSIKYLKDDVEVTYSAANYYFTKEANKFPEILLKQSSSWPSDIDNRAQVATITFVAGYGTDATNIPLSIKLCLMQMVTFLYENRGDCSTGGAGCGDCSGLPGVIKSLVLTWKIIDL